MKTRIVNIAAFWLLGIISTFAQNALSIDNVSVVAGQTVALDVKLKNDVTVAGLGFTLTLPKGISLVVDDEGEPVYSLNEERAKGTKFSVFSVAKDNGTYGFRIMPTSTSVIQGTDGIILSLQLQVDAKTASGTYKGQLTENSLTVKEENNALRTEKLSNGSFSVNVTAQSQEVTTDNSIYVEDMEVVAGQTVALDVKLKNDVTVAGLGFTLTLPDGIILVVDGDGEPVYSLNEERAKSTKFSVISSANENGTYGFRIMPTSTSVIQGTDGIILSLQLQVDSKTISGTYKCQLTENSLTVKEDNNALRTEVLDDKIVNVIVTETSIINKYKLLYVVDGVEYKTYEIEYGAAIAPESVPTKEGYTFSGWSAIPATMPAHDVTVTGSFTINKYKVTYIVDSEEYYSIEVVYGADVNPIEEPSKEGYTFSGWLDLPEEMPAHDVTVTGSFIINRYKVIYMLDGVEYGTSEVVYGAEVNPIGEPSKEGYTFSGWLDLPEEMPAHDVTVTGTFTVNKYKVTFMYGDNVLTTIEVNYGEAIELPESLNSERYTLIEWKDVPESMPAHDVIIYADSVDGIKTITADSKDEQYIRINGMYTNDLKRGVNIIRTQDGKTRKVWVK